MNTLIRWFWLTFFKNSCVKIELAGNYYSVGEYVYANKHLLRYLGKDWYLIIQ